MAFGIRGHYTESQSKVKDVVACNVCERDRMQRESAEKLIVICIGSIIVIIIPAQTLHGAGGFKCLWGNYNLCEIYLYLLCNIFYI